MLYVHHMHTLVCRVFKWNYEQFLYGQTFLPTDIRFARANAPLMIARWNIQAIRALIQNGRAAVAVNYAPRKPNLLKAISLENSLLR